MPELINDWDSKTRRVVANYGVKCRHCGVAEISESPATPKGWEEDKAPNVDGRTLAKCPDCLKGG